MSVIMLSKEGDIMETKDILFELRKKRGLTQDKLAKKLFVTRQAVSAAHKLQYFKMIFRFTALYLLFNYRPNI